MRKSYVTIYDLQMRKVAYLENAFGIQYETPLNALWSASFSLPANDPKNAECQPLYFAEIFDESERLELFRILPSTLRRSNDGQSIEYKCEHVLGTLLDDILFSYHTVGNLGVYTKDVLQYILARQSTQRWQLGTVSISKEFEYNWENENLLGALFSVPKPFDVEYMWTWDTTTYPWKLNLVIPSSTVQAYIRYGVNLQGIEKVVDPSNVVTRLYGLGYGEGVNQLTFSEINGGRPYIDAESTYIQKYGIMQSVFVDRSIEYPETLLASCRAMLNELKQPRISYTVQASELYALTKDPIDKFRTGTMVRVQDKELGEDVTVRVLNVRKADVIGAPGNVEIEIANRPEDIAGSITELRNRQYVNEVYAQGATNFDSHDFADNCDPTHPAILKFYIPEETTRINKVSLSYEVDAFRGYSKAIEAAPATTSGPSSKSTSGPSTRTTTAGGGGVVDTSTGIESWDLSSPPGLPEVMERAGGHNHGIPSGTQLMTPSGTVTFIESGEHAHGIRSHRHRFSLGDHVHSMDHTHEMDHTHTIPAHTHEIEFGIYEGPTPSAVTVRVDGTVVSGLGTSVEDIDIIPYLSKDQDEKVRRGTWHEIQIAPNDLGRIVASVHEQLFVQSRGGGNY
ncbi:phage tail protein [Paenibacillus cineris]|uniref:phage tail protein n=1 Tax=Paenibacillus cineris TaxID=237530 RepID=UPI001B071307|nr:phage tail protein [Paenibacillus cineris]GIO63589.1 hypothetical protein J43TS9_51630 [Paenibacillus cineris]